MMSMPDLHAMVDEFLAHRRSLGYAMANYASQLHSFAGHASRAGDWPLSAALALEWATLPRNATSSYHSKRLSHVRQFARYCMRIEPRTEIPPMGILGGKTRRPQPHIYSDEEVARLTAATRSLHPADGIRAVSYRILLGLLASTGIRIGEALRCEISDIDLGSGILTVRESKGISARAVPLHSSAVEQLMEYCRRRPAYLADPFETRLLIGDDGTPLEYWAVQGVFDRLRRKVGLGGTGKSQPRIHDLRHTYACRRLVAWQREGVDLNRAMSRLSAYMGHVQPTDTYWYVSIVPELLDNGSRRFERFANGKGDGK